MKALIITALELEYKTVRKFIDSLEEIVTKEGSIYEKGKYLASGIEIEVLLVQTGMGNEKSAIETERAIGFFRPNIVFLVGIAGGVKDVNIGDVVVADKIYSFESGKADSKFYPRPDLGKSSYSIVQRAKAECRTENWRSEILNDENPNNFDVFVGNICAGEKVVSSTKSSTYKFIKENYNDTAAIEMEGSGFIKAVYSNSLNIEAAIVRGISDLLNNKSETDSEGYQEIAARNASLFMFHLLTRLPSLQNAQCKYVITLNANIGIEDKKRLDEILQEIIKITDDYSVKMEKVEKGSIKITLSGTKSGFNKILDLYKKGELNKILDFELVEINEVLSEVEKLNIGFAEVAKVALKLEGGMRKGVVKFFNESRGFGFIQEQETEKEYFVHVSGLIDEISENDEVAFDITEGRKGLNAVNVKIK